MAEQTVFPLPNGDIFRVQSEEQIKQNIDALPKLRAAASGPGLLKCRYCPAQFGRGAELDEHEQKAHSIAAGTADTGFMDLGDGQVVSRELVKELLNERETAATERSNVRAARK